MMKKIVGTILALFLMVGVAFAQPGNWRVPDQATIDWGAITVLENGNPLPADNTIEYAIYLSLYPLTGDPQDYENQPLVGTTSNLTYTLTFTDEGSWVVGVQPIRKDSDGNEVSRSNISWSSDPAAVLDGNTFGWAVWYKPGNVSDLH